MFTKKVNFFVISFTVFSQARKFDLLAFFLHNVILYITSNSKLYNYLSKMILNTYESYTNFDKVNNSIY